MRLKKLFTAATLLSACSMTALLTGACADNRTTLFVSGVYGFAPGDSCELDVSLSANQLVGGVYDSLPGFHYFALLIVANGLQTLGDNDTLRPETSRIQVQGAEIAIATSTGATAAPAFTINFSGTISPDESEDPGVAILPVPIIPATLGLPPGDYLVGIKVFGETLGGTSVESGDFNFPVTVETPGRYSECEVAAAMPEGTVHPCGGLAQDGYYTPCLSVDSAACATFCNP